MSHRGIFSKTHLSLISKTMAEGHPVPSHTASSISPFGFQVQSRSTITSYTTGIVIHCICRYVSITVRYWLYSTFPFDSHCNELHHCGTAPKHATRAEKLWCAGHDMAKMKKKRQKAECASYIDEGCILLTSKVHTCVNFL